MIKRLILFSFQNDKNKAHKRARNMLLRRAIAAVPAAKAPLRCYRCLGGPYRTFSSSLPSREEEKHLPRRAQDEDDEIATSADLAADSDSTVSKPWYLNIVERPTQNMPLQQQEIVLPANSPKSLEAIATFLRDKLGLSDILIFDLRNFEDEQATAASKISDFMVMATAKSGRHGYKSFIELNTLLKQEFKTVGQVEGNISANELRRRQKRLARHTNLSKSMGSRTATTRSGSNLESWYMIDCRLDNIFVNILTENKRYDMNLEELYAPPGEKHLYRRAAPAEDMAPAEDDDNVLAGLKRLAARKQRRYYSTVPARAQIIDALSRQNFDLALNVASASKMDSLDFLKAACQSLKSMPYGVQIEGEKWVALFDEVWPLASSSQEFWSIRLELFKLLNCAAPDQVDVGGVLTGYLQFKLASGESLTKSDLIEFLQLVEANLTENLHVGYKDLVAQNRYVLEALKLYKGLNPQLILDSEVMCLLLSTMSITQNGSTSTLRAFYEMVEFASRECSQEPPVSVTATVLRILVNKQDYARVLKFWEKSIASSPEKDRRPWPLFLNTVAEAGDKEFAKKLIRDGHLLWIKRNGVKASPELKEAIERLFTVADPSEIAFKDMKDFLTVE
ncbi:LAQU0S01e11584g1_1 [Lachancea quebecensis]|uniref:ATPase synthesis protein 25 n=1 Tax=Lachancea quebecensis TaxID=1654605 RepID=A0A0N7MKX0_9SACH|nr:LAQU0S01e11584g1_1 [Lachancea quebecensis]